MNQILQLKITLDETNPPIWRRVLIPSDISFFDLHHVFQITMGWTNSHLFEFQVGDCKIGYVDRYEEGYEDVTDAKGVLLDLLLNEGLVFKYIYDFGDYWKHTVEVEKILEKDNGKVYPVCLNGQLACPHEDSGGIGGHYQNLEILKDKKHPEYAETRLWIGRNYNPEKFNLDKVNKELPRFKKYMKHWRG